MRVGWSGGVCGRKVHSEYNVLESCLIETSLTPSSSPHHMHLLVVPSRPGSIRLLHCHSPSKLQLPTSNQALLDTCHFTAVARATTRLLSRIKDRLHTLHLLLLGLVLELLLDSGVAVRLWPVGCEALVLGDCVGDLEGRFVSIALLLKYYR